MSPGPLKLGAIAITVIIAIPIILGYGLASEDTEVQREVVTSTTNLSDMILNSSTDYYMTYSGPENNSSVFDSYSGSITSPDYISTGTNPTSLPIYTETANRTIVSYTPGATTEQSQTGTTDTETTSRYGEQVTISGSPNAIGFRTAAGALPSDPSITSPLNAYELSPTVMMSLYCAPSTGVPSARVFVDGAQDPTVYNVGNALIIVVNNGDSYTIHYTNFSTNSVTVWEDVTSFYLWTGVTTYTIYYSDSSEDYTGLNTFTTSGYTYYVADIYYYPIGESTLAHVRNSNITGTSAYPAAFHIFQGSDRVSCFDSTYYTSTPSLDLIAASIDHINVYGLNYRGQGYPDASCTLNVATGTSLSIDTDEFDYTASASSGSFSFFKKVT